MKVVLVGHLSDTNLGDAAIVTGTVRLLRACKPGIEVGVVPTMPTNTLQERDLAVCRAEGLAVHVPLCPLPVREVSPERGLALYARTALGILRGALFLATARGPLRGPERETVRALRDADLVLLVGGSSLRAEGRSSHLVHVWRILFPVFAALRLRKRVACLGASVGPIEPGLPGRLLRFGLRRGWTIYARDEETRRELERITGRPARFVPDLALGLGLGECAAAGRNGARPRAIGISLRPLPDADGVADSLVQAVEALDPRPPEVALLANAFGPSPKQDDRAPLRALGERLTARGFRVVELECRTPAEARDAYAGLDAVLGVRMHAAILARLAGTPSVPLEYEGHKARGVFAYLAPGLEVRDVHGSFAAGLAEDVERYVASGLPEAELRALRASVRLLEDTVSEVLDG